MATVGIAGGGPGSNVGGVSGEAVATVWAALGGCISDKDVNGEAAIVEDAPGSKAGGVKVDSVATVWHGGSPPPPWRCRGHVLYRRRRIGSLGRS